MNDDPYVERRRLTFEQAEGAEPLPRQLQPKEVSDELRAVLWAYVYQSMDYETPVIDKYVDPSWQKILRDAWVLYDKEPLDEYRSDYKSLVQYVKAILMRGTYVRVLGFMQFVLRHTSCPLELPARFS